MEKQKSILHLRCFWVSSLFDMYCCCNTAVPGICVYYQQVLNKVNKKMETLLLKKQTGRTARLEHACVYKAFPGSGSKHKPQHTVRAGKHSVNQEFGPRVTLLRHDPTPRTGQNNKWCRSCCAKRACLF